jgi:hypothetical protein
MKGLVRYGRGGAEGGACKREVLRAKAGGGDEGQESGVTRGGGGGKG